MTKYLLSIFLLISVIACQPSTIEQKDNFVIDLPDTSLTESKLPIGGLYYEIKNTLVDELNLERLEDKRNSFEIRLWKKEELFVFGQLMIIKKIDQQWVCLNYLYTTSSSNQKPKKGKYSYFSNFKVKQFRVIKKVALMDWNDFFSTLDSNNFYDLRDQTETPNFIDEVSDGTSYMVEILDSNKYRFFTFHQPDYFAEQYESSKKMWNIIQLFDSNFGFFDFRQNPNAFLLEN